MAHMTQLWTVAIDGASRPYKLGVGTAHHLVPLPDGSYVLGRHTSDPVHNQFKGYRGRLHRTFVARQARRFERLAFPPEWNLRRAV